MAADYDITGSRIVSTFNSESTVTRFSTFNIAPTPRIVDAFDSGGGGGGSTRPTTGFIYPRGI